MNFFHMLQQRADAGRPVRVGLIGAGKFGSMFLSQVPATPGLEVAVIADLDPERARPACLKVGWNAAHIARTRFVSSGAEACGDADVEVVVEATGIPSAGIAHARAAMAAIANATGLTVPENGLGFPPCGVDDLPHVLRGKENGGVLQHDGMVEVVSCLERDGRPVFRDLRWGVYVVLKAPNEYARTCFREYGLKTNASGWYAAMYKPYHLIGLELGISVLSAALRGEPTGQTRDFAGDVVAVAKRMLRAGESLDGEGGYTVWGKLVPASRSLAESAVPIGLAHGIKLVRDVAAGQTVRWSDVAATDSEAMRVRRDMERRFAPQMAAQAAAQ